jgi:hypothetical protein
MDNISISKGNSKIGKTANISLPPVTTCRKAVPCASKCYAKKAYRMYPSTRKAWDGNLAFYKQYGAVFFGKIHGFLNTYKGRFFRWHVSGDIVDANYFAGMVTIAEMHPKIAFLAFTKKYEIVNEFVRKGGKIPRNFKVIFSQWDGLKVSRFTNNPYRFHVSRFENKETILNGFRCPGECETCRYCWYANKREVSVSPEH